MKHQAFRLSFSFLICIVHLSLFIASCGTTSSTSSMTLKVAQATTSISLFPFYIAEQEHFFKAQGLTLVPDPPPVLGTGPKLDAAIEAGSVEIAPSSVTDTFTVSRVDAYIRMLGAFSTDYLNDLIVSKHFEQQSHLTESSSLADKVKALLGKKIAVSASGSPSDALVTYLFRQFGYDASKDVTKVFLGTDPAAGLGALSQGRVDAITFPTPTGQFAQAQGVGDLFISPVHGDVPDMGGQLYGVIYARQQVIDAKPKAVQAYIRGLAQALAWIHKNQAQAKVLLAKFLKQKQSLADTIFDATLPSLPQTPQISQKSYEVANQFHVKAGLIALPLSYNLVDTSTINTALSGLPGSS